MADRIPVKAIYSGAYGSSDVTSLGELASGETINGSYITDNTIDEANLKVSNTPTNGYVLTAQSGASGGLTWAADTDTNTDTKWDGGTTGLTASTGRTSLGLAIGTDVQAYDADNAVTDADQSWTGSQRGTPSVVTDGTLDLNTANNFKYTPAATPDTLEFTNETAGQSGFITVINPSGHTIALGGEVKKSSTWDVSTAGTYLVSYYSDGTNVYLSASAALT